MIHSNLRCVFINFSPNLLNGLICEVGTGAKRKLVAQVPSTVQSGNPGNRQDFRDESFAHIAGHCLPRSTYFNLP